MKNIIDTGIDKYVKDKIHSNDKNWFVIVIIICIIFTGYILIERNNKDSRFEQFKALSIEKCNKFQDSIVTICDAEYNVTGRCIGRAKK